MTEKIGLSGPAANDDKPRGTCPICKKTTEAKWRPFCSNRCANLDMSRWLNGKYAIPVADADDDEDGDDIGAGVARLMDENGELD